MASCGLTEETAKKDTTGEGSALDLVWPEGYAFDPQTAALTGRSLPHGLAAPAYVTQIILRVSGPEMEPLELDVPLDTLRVKATVTAGFRRFDVLVRTNIGVSFTGSTTADILPGSAPVVRIELEVNGPPVIERIDISNTTPKSGEIITISGTASDPDPDDTLEYRWTGSVQSGEHTFGASGQTVTGAAIGGGRVDITLTVTDGKGGVATKTVSIFIFNRPPVINSFTASPSIVKRGDYTQLECVASDPDNTPLEIWLHSNTGSFFGSTRNYQYMGYGDEVFECEVDDRADTVFATTQINHGQAFKSASQCTTALGTAKMKFDVSWNSNDDVDIEVTDPNGVKTYYGYIRPGNGSELCIDKVCMDTPESHFEPVYWANNPPLGTYTVKVTHKSECGGVNNGANITVMLELPYSGCSTLGDYCMNVTGDMACGPLVSSCTEVWPLASGASRTYNVQVLLHP
ncbi:MAG: hypothetical protein HY804_01415 [Nitrospinae bacterium]|nr:hypothetical protein [Nitrospinota bacterium]